MCLIPSARPAPRRRGCALLCSLSPLAGSLAACRGDRDDIGKHPCRGARARRRRRARSVGEAPSAPSAGRFRSVWMSAASSQPARVSQRGSGGWRRGGEGARRGEGGRQGSREGGREERRTQRAPGSWSFCSAWPGFNAQQQRAAAAAGSPGAPAAAEPAAAPLPAPCKLCEQPARGAGGAPGRPGSARSRSISRRRSPAPPRGAAGGSRGPPAPAPQHCPASPPAGAGAAAARPAAGCWGAAAAAQGDTQRRRERSPAGPQRTRCARAAARPGEHGRRGVTPPCPLGIKDIQPAGVGTKGNSPRRCCRCSGSGAGWRKGVLGIDPRLPTFLLDIWPTLDAARGAVKPRRL